MIIYRYNQEFLEKFHFQDIVLSNQLVAQTFIIVIRDSIFFSSILLLPLFNIEWYRLCVWYFQMNCVIEEIIVYPRNCHPT